MGRVNYRVVTLFAALGAAVLSATSLAFLVTALISFRADDFLTASKTDDFTTLGTCIETLSEDQVTALEYTDPDLKCEDDRERGNRKSVRNSLAVSVHGVMWAWFFRPDSDTLFKTYIATVDPDPNENKLYHFQQVVGAMLTHIEGGTHDPGTGNQIPNIPQGINYTTAQAVLRELSKMDVPVSCDFYTKDDAKATPFSFTTDVSDDHLANSGVAVSAETAKATGTTHIPGRYWDTPLETYIKNIRKGRMNSDEEIKDTWPLADLIVDCDAEARSPGAGPAPDTGIPGDWSVVGSAVKEKLYAHCIAQFQYASVGTVTWEGTYGIPLPGIEPGPFFSPYPQADGFNSTSSYNMRTRMYLGQRFGWSVWAYVPMFLATCFLLADAVVFFIAEAVMPLTLADTKKYSVSALNQARDSLVIAATTRSSRKKRLALGFFAVFSSCVFYVVFIAGPWGFWYTNLPRPKCEKSVENDPSSLNTGIAPEHGVPQVGWKGTKGGWKSDYDATWYDIAAIVSQLFVLLLLPLTTTEACRKWNSSLSGGGDERAVKAAISDQAQIVSNTAKYRMHQRVFVVVMGVAVLGILVGQAISGARFGMAWAEGVVQQEWDADGTGWLFDEVALAEAVYDQTVATLALTVACGLVFATALQRHLINGVGCYSAALFFAWVALVCVFALPLTIYAAQRSIFNEKAASKDCVHFPRTSHEFENDLCVSRFWTLLIGGIIFVGTLLLITGMGAAEAIPALLKTRKRAAVFLVENAPPSQVFRASTPGMAMQSGYRSESEPFFNYAAKPTEPSDSLLYAPQMKLSIPRR
jgi:hypothetical protein